jgi:periplasmic protein TonB
MSLSVWTVGTKPLNLPCNQPEREYDPGRLKSQSFYGAPDQLYSLLIIIAMPGLAKADTVEKWRKEIATRLEGNKRFPPAALDQRGTAKVSFVLDRNGRLVSHWLVESAGSPALDEESLAIIERAQPFPVPPPNLKEDQLRLAIAFVFATRPGPSWEQEEARLRAKVQSICRGC